MSSRMTRSRWPCGPWAAGLANADSRASASASPAPTVQSAGSGAPTHSSQALASAIRWPARLPLSTDDT
ncbi:hypothetical protein D9M69_658770 [compost metagenome]